MMMHGGRVALMVELLPLRPLWVESACSLFFSHWDNFFVAISTFLFSISKENRQNISKKNLNETYGFQFRS